MEVGKSIQLSSSERCSPTPPRAGCSCSTPALGVAAVGAATHLFLWLWRDRARRSIVRFAWLVVALMLGAFLAGNVMYPTYKVEVRAAYLENPARSRRRDGARARGRPGRAREHERPARDATHRVLHRAARRRAGSTSRSTGSRSACSPRSRSRPGSCGTPAEGAAIRHASCSALAGIAAGTTWLAAIIGVLTASWRAV